MYKSLIFPMLAGMEPERAHDLAAGLLAHGQEFGASRWLIERWRGRVREDPVVVGGVRFPNRLGVAAGFDKEVRIAPGLAAMGFGHVEVGTLTPEAQEGNERPRIFRLRGERALINRMGFPNPGVRAVGGRLGRLAGMAGRRWVLGVSIGKQKETALEEALGDYVTAMRGVYRTADYVAVNVSSPNTPELRRLQGEDYFGELCRGLVAEREALAERVGARRPLFVKLAPDVTGRELEAMVGAMVEAGVDGVIATNTTVSRRGVRSRLRGEAGGLSGAPLRRRSTAMIRAIARLAEGRLAIIGVGGVATAEDAREKIEAGASLVQVYTGLVYEGPGMAGRILRGLGSEGGV